MDGRPRIHPNTRRIPSRDFRPATGTGRPGARSTTHINKAEHFRRDAGIPRAANRTTPMEIAMRHGTLMTHVTIATDPGDPLTEPLIMSQEFVLMDRPESELAL